MSSKWMFLEGISMNQRPDSIASEDAVVVEPGPASA